MNIRDIIPRSSRGSSLSRPSSIFDEFFERGLGPWGEIGAFSPVVDVAEKEGGIEVTAELPGLEEKDVDVTIDAHGLTLRGEKKKEKKEERESYYRMERSYGGFQRYIPLSSEVDRDKVKAHFKNGVLKIHLPKTGKEIQQGKKIQIEA